MKVKISNMSFKESSYNKEGRNWKAETLYLFAKAKGYEVRDMPLWCIDLSDPAFVIGSLSDFIFQCKRVENCSLDHPIILDDKGRIADGYHRLCKAIIAGHETIKAIRMEEMPAPDYIDS